MKITSTKQVLDLVEAVISSGKLTSTQKGLISYTFDVRKSGATVAHAHVENLKDAQEAGQELRPMITFRNGKKFSALDGRHLKSMNDGLDTETVDTYLLPFDWEALSPTERQFVRFAALVLNMPSKGSAPRLYAGLPDAENQIIEALRLGLGKLEIRETFSKHLTTNQFEYVYKKAYSNVYNAKAQAIRNVRRANPSITPIDAVVAVGGNPQDKRLISVATETSLRTPTGPKKRVRGHHWGKRVTAFLRGLGEQSRVITLMYNEMKEGRKGLSPEKFRVELKRMEVQRKSIDAAYRDVLERGQALLGE